MGAMLAVEKKKIKKSTNKYNETKCEFSNNNSSVNLTQSRQQVLDLVQNDQEVVSSSTAQPKM